MRLVLIAIGCAASALAVAGALLPALPTTPFLLVAAYAFARSSPRFHGWLLNHRQFGPLIRNWQRHGSIDPASKRLAILLMAAALIASWLLGFSARVLAVQVLALGASAAFILTRPSGPAA